MQKAQRGGGGKPGLVCWILEVCQAMRLKDPMVPPISRHLTRVATADNLLHAAHPYTMTHRRTAEARETAHSAHRWMTGEHTTHPLSAAVCPTPPITSDNHTATHTHSEQEARAGDLAWRLQERIDVEGHSNNPCLARATPLPLSFPLSTHAKHTTSSNRGWKLGRRTAAALVWRQSTGISSTHHPTAEGCCITHLP